MRPEKISDAWMSWAEESNEPARNEGRKYDPDSYESFKAYLFSSEENRAKSMPVQFLEEFLLDEDVMVIWLLKKHLCVCREATTGDKIYFSQSFRRLEDADNDCQKFDKDALIELYDRVGIEETIAQMSNDMERWKLLENGEKPKLSGELIKPKYSGMFFFRGETCYYVESGKENGASAGERWYYEKIGETYGTKEPLVRLLAPEVK